MGGCCYELLDHDHDHDDGVVMPLGCRRARTAFVLCALCARKSQELLWNLEQGKQVLERN